MEKYHNTNLDKVKAEHPDWEKNPSEHTKDFYAAYMVTEEQHDEWEAWAKEYTKKVTGIRGRLFDKSWWSVYLNTAPQVIKTKKDEL